MRICLNLRTLSHFSNQKIIFFFGAPGVGKGTYSKMLAKDLSYNHISTGD
jgi:2-phosphoglycerate kinase